MFHRTGHKIRDGLLRPTPEQLTMLKRIVARGKEYGAYYFQDSPLNHFVAWLEAELLRAEADLESAELTTPAPGGTGD